MKPSVFRWLVDLLGGPAKLARSLGVYPSTVTRWTDVPERYLDSLNSELRPLGYEVVAASSYVRKAGAAPFYTVQDRNLGRIALVTWSPSVDGGAVELGRVELDPRQAVALGLHLARSGWRYLDAPSLREPIAGEEARQLDLIADTELAADYQAAA
jgi:hypothetical protein